MIFDMRLAYGRMSEFELDARKHQISKETTARRKGVIPPKPRRRRLSSR